MNREELQNLAHKIDYEGGLAEYFIGYGGPHPSEVDAKVDAFKIAYYELHEELERIFCENDIIVEY